MALRKSRKSRKTRRSRKSKVASRRRTKQKNIKGGKSRSRSRSSKGTRRSSRGSRKAQKRKNSMSVIDSAVLNLGVLNSKLRDPIYTQYNPLSGSTSAKLSEVSSRSSSNSSGTFASTPQTKLRSIALSDDVSDVLTAPAISRSSSASSFKSTLN